MRGSNNIQQKVVKNQKHKVSSGSSCGAVIPDSVKVSKEVSKEKEHDSHIGSNSSAEKNMLNS